MSGAIAGITESVSKVKGLVDEVSIASRQQTQGIDQVTRAVSDMDHVTQANAAHSEETTALAQTMHQQTDRLKDSIASLVLLLDGRSGESEQPLPPRRPPATKAPGQPTRRVAELVPAA